MQIYTHHPASRLHSNLVSSAGRKAGGEGSACNRASGASDPPPKKTKTCGRPQPPSSLHVLHSWPPCHTPSCHLDHVHGVLRQEGVDVAEGGPQFAVPAPAAQHQLIEALGANGRPVQVHLGWGRARQGAVSMPRTGEAETPKGIHQLGYNILIGVLGLPVGLGP